MTQKSSSAWVWNWQFKTCQNQKCALPIVPGEWVYYITDIGSLCPACGEIAEREDNARRMSK